MAGVTLTRTELEENEKTASMIGKRRVYLHLYSGDRILFKVATHSSLYIEGDAFEWTYSNASDPKATHGVTYKGVVYERPFQYT